MPSSATVRAWAAIRASRVAVVATTRSWVVAREARAQVRASRVESRVRWVRLWVDSSETSNAAIVTTIRATRPSITP